ncbi:7539_t:CDS:2, partial [Entrophospora sp. SA101]
MPHQNPSELPSTATKENLKSWWKQFTAKKGKREDEGKENDHRGVFGVSLAEGIHYASVPICMTAADGQQYVYGYIPIIVAKCGMLSGSAKRIKELQIKFDTPPSYGKTLDWTGYSVHDAANIFRRYLNQLPDPVIPLQWYDAFRSVHYPTTRVINYQKLIANLPKENQHLLLYILDLLAVFSSKSSENLMPSSNLASIFQPGVLSHPSHNMSPEQYKLSQEVLGFLIEHQNYFLPTSNITTAGNNNASSSTNDTFQPNNVIGDNSPQNLKEPFDLNNPPVKRISLRRQSLSHEPFALDTTLPSSSSEIQPSESTGLVRSRTLPSKRPKYSENRNSNSEYKEWEGQVTPGHGKTKVHDKNTKESFFTDLKYDGLYRSCSFLRIKLVVDKTAIPLAEFAISHFVALEEHFERIAKNFKYRSGQFTPPTQMSFMCKLPDTPQQKGPKQVSQPIFTNARLLLSQKVSEASISTLPVDSIPQ